MRFCFFLSLLNGYLLSAFLFTDYLKTEFNRSFHKQCDKYPFVQRYFDLLKHPDKKYIVFVFQDTRLKNGGIGDRFAGLLSAVSMALRFNRTLLIRSNIHFGYLFRPYHPADAHSAKPKFNYEEWTSWTHYDSKWANNDDTEYDLWDCINTTGKRNEHCSMDDGDPPQPILLVRSNRAFLCRDMLHTELKSHQELLNMTSEHVQGGHLDLFEVAGCMMRLALWPTDTLWNEVDRAYDHLTAHLHLPLQHKGSDQTAAGTGTVGVEPLAPYYQVGMHFRCGDRTYIQSDYDKYCLYHPEYAGYSEDELVAAGVFNVYSQRGNPYQLGTCAAKSTGNHSTHMLPTRHRRVLDSRDLPVAASGRSNRTSSSSPSPLILSFAASDNKPAAEQMSMYALKTGMHINGAMVSPPGCHIELQQTYECLLETVVYWFMLSSSDVLVMQTDGRAPASAFSRYALLYGLKKRAFRNARDCDSIVPSHVLAVSAQGNWFC